MIDLRSCGASRRAGAFRAVLAGVALLASLCGAVLGEATSAGPASRPSDAPATWAALPTSRPATQPSTTDEFLAAAASAEMGADASRAAEMAREALKRDPAGAAAKALLDRVAPLCDAAARRRAAESGDARAMAVLAFDHLEHRDGAARDPADAAKAAKWARASADAGDPLGMVALGQLYLRGEGVPKDPARAADLFGKGAEAGSPMAMKEWADCYAHGEGVDQSYDRAFEWYSKSAAAGYAPAMTALGEAYRRGAGVTRDRDHAFAWQSRAAALGNAAAAGSLGACYVQGTGTVQDVNQGLALLRSAFAAGDVESATQLGRLYLEGDGVSKDPEEGRRWLLKGAAAGNAAAMTALAAVYINGLGVPRDDAEAVKWARAGAERSDAYAMWNLAALYGQGRGVPEDGEAANAWMSRSARAGNVQAMEWIVKHTQDSAEAAQWRRRAAEGGSTEAMNRLGLDYSAGKGVPQDAAEAFKWYRRAARAGSVPAMSNLAFAYLGGTGVAADERQARRWMRAAAFYGDEYCKKWLDDHHDPAAAPGGPCVAGAPASQPAVRSGPAGAPVAEFPVAHWGRYITIPVPRGDRVVEFVVDSGATLSMVDIAEFPDIEPAGESRIDTAGGSRTLEMFQPPDIHVGPFCLADLGLVSRMDLTQVRESTGRPVAGVLGLSAMKALVLQIDFDGRKARFLSPDDQAHPEWGTAFHMRMGEATPIVRLKFAGRFGRPGGGAAKAAGGDEQDFQIDTGSNSYLSLPTDAFNRLAAATGRPARSRPTTTANGVVDLRTIRVPEVELAGDCFRDALIDEHKSDVPSLGLRFLERYVATLDFPHGRLYLKPGNEIGRRDEANMSGVYFLFRGGQLLVERVESGTPASEAGLEPGDVIVRLNGKPAGEYDMAEIREEMSAGEGKEITLTYRRGGAEHTVTLKLRRDI